MGTSHHFSYGAPGLGLSDPIQRAKVSPASLRVVFQVFNRWNIETLSARVLLGDPPRSTFFAWKKGAGPALSVDGLTRVSYILGIYEALQRLFGLAREQADMWISQPNSAALFGGKRPIEIMLGGGLPGLHAVRAYLESAVGNPPTRDANIVQATI